ncbi:MAG: phytanoyl-CoA dioxygenase family protein [Saprospiraceae bacterium]|nr:phytanoyl-CoA dioxygenase family protein [Saprospiraceae bacterium]
MINSILQDKGFAIHNGLYTNLEIDDILEFLDNNSIKSQFGVREIVHQHPQLAELVFTPNLKQVVCKLAPDCHTCIKSIYFDKPPHANWVVNWHQDLTINLDQKKEIKNYKNWRVTKDRVVVQPDLHLLESIFTIRIHLDDCTEENGALRVIPTSHKNGVIDMKEWIKYKTGREQICEVQKGGILIMKPLLLHASRRTENQQSRRVLHLEFTDQQLPDGIKWKEKVSF